MAVPWAFLALIVSKTALLKVSIQRRGAQVSMFHVSPGRVKLTPSIHKAPD